MMSGKSKGKVGAGVFKGKIRQWNKDKKFGLIGLKGKRDIFIHISELPRLSREPKVGDKISYQIMESENGQVQAVNGIIKGVTEELTEEQKQQSGVNKLVILIAVFFTAMSVYHIVESF